MFDSKEVETALRKIALNVRFKRKQWTVRFPLMKASTLDEVAIELKEIVKEVQQVLQETKNGQLYEVEVEVKETGYIWWYPVFEGVRK